MVAPEFERAVWSLGRVHCVAISACARVRVCGECVFCVAENLAETSLERTEDKKLEGLL